MTDVWKILNKRFAAKKRQRRGYSLIELGIVLGVVAGLVVGVLFLAQTVTTQNKISNLNQLVTRVAAVTYRVTGLDGSITDGEDLMPLLKATGEFPASSIATKTGNDEMSMPFGGSVLTLEGESDNKFIITVNSLPENACFALGQNLLLSRDSLDALTFKIGTGTAVTATLASDDAADVAGDCGADSTVTATFK